MELWPFEDSSVEKNNNMIVECYEKIWDLYFSKIEEVFKHFGLYKVVKQESTQSFSAVYTPLHGTGGPFAYEVFKRLGLSKSFLAVKEQFHSNPHFPTVEFPNPEENNVLSLSYELAKVENIGLVVANDPDADRFSISEKQKFQN